VQSVITESGLVWLVKEINRRKARNPSTHNHGTSMGYAGEGRREKGCSSCAERVWGVQEGRGRVQSRAHNHGTSIGRCQRNKKGEMSNSFTHTLSTSMEGAREGRGRKGCPVLRHMMTSLLRQHKQSVRVWGVPEKESEEKGFTPLAQRKSVVHEHSQSV